MTTPAKLLLFLTLPLAGAARADLIHFDDLPAGTVLGTQYPALSALGGPVISAHTNVSKFNCLAQVEPSTATALDGGGQVLLDFTAPRSRVKVRAGYALDPSATKGGPATITLRAWGYDNKTSSWYLAATDTKTVTGPNSFASLEICRPLSNDILSIGIEASGSRIEVLDNLEHFDYSASPSWSANFDTVPANSSVTGHYAGVQFNEAAIAVNASLMTATAGSGSQIVVPFSQPESHEAPFSFDLEPAQGVVKLRTGYPGSAWNANPLTVRVQAFNASGVEVAREDRTYNAVTPLSDPVELCRWDQQDIARVSVHFLDAGGTPRGLGGVECFDSLQFGPVDPATLTDSIAPQVFIAGPAAYEVNEVMNSLSDNSRTFALDAYSFENLSQSEMWLETQNTVTGDTTTTPLTFFQLGEIPTYTPPGGSPVTVPAGDEVQTASTVVNYGPGSWRFRVLARDTAGNVSVVSTGNERLRTLTPLAPSTVTALTTAPFFMGQVNVVGTGNVWNPPAGTANTQVTVQGTNLHQDSYLYFVRGINATPPAARERYAATAVPGSLNPARTEVRFTVPGVCFNMAANENVHDWEMWVQDVWSRPGVAEWTKLGDARVGPWHPEVYGFAFRNVGGNSFGLADFDCIFGRTLMLNGSRSGIRNPSRMLFAAAALPILSLGEGHCYGYSMTTSHMRRGWLNPAFYTNPAAVSAHDLSVLGSEFYHGGDLFELALPGSLFSQVKAFHGGQLSHEVINHVLSQMTGGFSWQGNPVAVLDRIRANPHDYIVTMLSASTITESHVLTPYAVRDLDATWSEIWVYDSNFHGTMTGTQTGPVNPANGRPRWTVFNDHCHNTRILVNRVTNRFSYCLNDPYRGVQSDRKYAGGTGIYTIPISMFLSDRRPPSVGQLLDRVLTMFLAGSAQPRYTGAGGMVGINPDGSEVNTLSGAYALPLSSDGEVEDIGPFPSPFSVSLPGASIGQVTAELRHTGSEGAHFYAADAGVIFQLSSTGAASGETDHVTFDRAVTPMDTVALVPGGSGRTWYPRIGLENADGSALVWRVLGLNAGSGERIEFAPRTGSTASGDEWLDLRNRTGHALTFRLILERGTPASTAPDAAAYGPLTLPSGGNVRLYPLPGGQMNFALDANADGTPETVTPLTGGSLFSGSAAITDCNGNGIPDALDIAEGRFADANGDLIPDICQASASVQLLSVTPKPGSIAIALQLSGTPGSTWRLERSATLDSWTTVETLTFESGAVSRTVSEPAGTARTFYRLAPD